MAYKTITLTREDLGKIHESKPIEEIGVYDFHSHSVTLKQIEEADYIEFKDGDKVKVLKNK